jgi:aquaporin Z
MFRKLIVEAIGTFFLVFTVGQCVISPGAGPLAPIAIGASLIMMIYAGGRISGAHYNPAVSVAVRLRGKLSNGEFVGYVCSQFFGAAVATAATRFLKQGTLVTAGAIIIGPSVLAEFIFTFALCFVVLNVATVKSVAGNSYYGLAIGSTVIAGAFAVGSVSGGAFNPAVAVGITLLHLSAPTSLWVLLVGEILGSVAAAGIFVVLKLDDQS